VARKKPARSSVAETTGANLAGARASLLRWYAANRRDLPWRHTSDPYAIWVSEVMLQQTRVETVLRYYEPFLARFPTTHALAAASEDDVLAAWSGLGYYRRGRLLHQGVREVVARYAGRVPEAPEDRLALPGIGRYTAGAIGSIAFDRPEPIVDGNVARVLCRLKAISTPLGRADTERRLWSDATAWVDGPCPGDLNQALMELGATVCTPRSPDCDHCPLRPSCVAQGLGQTDTLPTPRTKKAPTAVDWVAVFASDADGNMWLSRGRDGLFAGLWNLPMAEGRGRARVLKLVAELGLDGTMGTRAVATVEHVLTHRHMRVQLWRLSHATGDGESTLRSLPASDLGTIGTSRLTLKLVAAALLAGQRVLHYPASL
jgi:A/G-specific adenine glycosylase